MLLKRWNGLVRLKSVICKIIVSHHANGDDGSAKNQAEGTADSAVFAREYNVREISGIGLYWAASSIPFSAFS